MSHLKIKNLSLDEKKKNHPGILFKFLLHIFLKKIITYSLPKKISSKLKVVDKDPRILPCWIAREIIFVRRDWKRGSYSPLTFTYNYHFHYQVTTNRTFFRCLLKTGILKCRKQNKPVIFYFLSQMRSVFSISQGIALSLTFGFKTQIRKLIGLLITNSYRSFHEIWWLIFIWW